MEQSILENSKGATYMSFILDIEIVIKKEGARSNVAENKAKNQVPKKGDSKDTYPSSQKQNMQVYAMSADPKNIFDFSISPQQKDQEASLETKKASSRLTTPGKQGGKKTDKLGSEASLTKTKDVSDKNNKLSGSLKAPKYVEDKNASDEGVGNDQEETQKKKKKITKADKKAKVFKGKVEAIDFLECNRIFLCNYFKIKNNQDSSRKSESVSVLNDSCMSKPRSIEEKHHFQSISNPIIHAKKTRSRKRFTFFTSNSCEDIKSSETGLFLRTHLAGDFETTQPANVQTNNMPISEKKTKKYHRFQKMLQKKQTLIRGFKSKENTSKTTLKEAKKSCQTLQEQQLLEHQYTNKKYTNLEKDSKNEILRKRASAIKVKDDISLVISTEEEKNRAKSTSQGRDLLRKNSEENQDGFSNMEIKNPISDLKLMFFNETECSESKINCVCRNQEEDCKFQNNSCCLKQEISSNMVNINSINGNSNGLFNSGSIDSNNKENSSFLNFTIEGLSKLEMTLLDKKLGVDLPKPNTETNHDLNDINDISEDITFDSSNVTNLMKTLTDSPEQVENAVLSTTGVESKPQFETDSYEPNKVLCATKVEISNVFKKNNTFLQKIQKFTSFGKKTN